MLEFVSRLKIKNKGGGAEGFGGRKLFGKKAPL